jgi:hypothetical protein
VTLEGEVGYQNGQPEIWTSSVYAAPMFGAPRQENCVRLVVTGPAITGQAPRGRVRRTGTVIAAQDLPKAWGIACPSSTALRVLDVRLLGDPTSFQ